MYEIDVFAYPQSAAVYEIVSLVALAIYLAAALAANRQRPEPAFKIARA
ncbi:MAG: hypothetical protein JO237_00805 [Pseudolabrys sp.]|nr:hypothetical protein [Pseudolabrys sp.]